MTAAELISRMDTGQKVSATGHIGLILWVALFDLFAAPESEPKIPVADVSIISAQDFAALQAAQPPAPQPPAPQPEAIRPPEPIAPPPPAPAPEPLPAPEPIQPPAPIAPAPVTPPPAPEPAPVVPPSTGAIFAPAPISGADVRPRPRPVDRVAPQPVEAPPETAVIDTAARPATRPDPAASTQAPVVEQAETAPPEATTEIVTEATETDTNSLERASGAPLTSPRPRPRPAQLAAPAPSLAPEQAPTEQTAQAPAPTPAPAPDAPASSADIADALADVLAGLSEPAPSAPAGPSGGALAPGEADALRLAIQQCWNIGALSTDAMMVTVTVAFSMTPAAQPEQGTIRVVGASGGSEAAIAQAFEAARRAIIRCAGDGYGLPAAQYESWRDVEITFNPEGMRLR